MTTRLSASEATAWEQINELFVGMSVEHQRATVGVKCYFQHTCFRAGQASIRKTIAICVKAGHVQGPCVSSLQWAVTPDGKTNGAAHSWIDLACCKFFSFAIVVFDCELRLGPR
jgi:hypothetical protein